MPYKPKVPCKHPGCAELVKSGTKYCEKHKALHPKEVRSAAKRGYGRIFCSESCRYAWKNRNPRPEKWKSTWIHFPETRHSGHQNPRGLHSCAKILSRQGRNICHPC